jgi:cytoskeleton protein RodZ
MNLKELGERFRAERERKGLSVTEVVQRTKISKTNVLALEAGDPEGLPHPVYAKGFVRNYARLLGLDPEECAAIVAANYVAEDNVSVPQPSLDGPDLEILGPGRGRAKLWIFLAGILAIVLLAGGVFLLTSHNEAPRQEAAPAPQQQAAPEQTPEPLQEPAPAPEQAPGQTQEQAPAQEQTSEQQPPVQEPQAAAAVAAAPAASGVAGTQGAAPAAAPAPAAAAAAQSAPAPAAQAGAASSPRGEQRLTVTAREACWIYARADGNQGPVVDVVLQPGETHTLHFRKEMELKLGNAGGVSVTFNGEKVPLQAQSGQVRSLTFTAP